MGRMFDRGFHFAICANIVAKLKMTWKMDRVPLMYIRVAYLNYNESDDLLKFYRLNENMVSKFFEYVVQMQIYT